MGLNKPGEVSNFLEFLPLFADVDGVRTMRVFFSHATAVCMRRLCPAGQKNRLKKSLHLSVTCDPRPASPLLGLIPHIQEFGVAGGGDIAATLVNGTIQC